MPELIVNERDLIRARESLLLGSMDAKRPQAWTQFGYPETLTPEHFLRAYLRGGPAHGAIHHILDHCWQEAPRIRLKASEDVSPWEERLAGILEKVNAWPKLQDWDRRNMVGRYAGLILRVADGKALREPLMRASRLVDLVPVYEQQLRVTGWDSDTTSPTYGQPAMWQYRRRLIDGTDKQVQPDEWQDVHPSRVIILAEGAVGDDFFEGVPLLQAGYNALIDLEKVSGGSGESYLKNSARTLRFNFSPDADPTKLVAPKSDGSAVTPDDVKEALQERVDRVNRNIDGAIIGQGVEVDTLQTTMHSPRDAWEIAATTFAASVRIPFTILFGQQTGRLASDEDKAADNLRCKSRQRNLLGPAILELVRRLQGCGIVEPGDVVVEWAPLDSPGDKEKSDLAGKMAQINKDMLAAGLRPAFTENEVRAVMDYEEMEEDDLGGEGGEDPPDDDAEDDPPDGGAQ